jgi:hypothetical protein
MGPNKTVRADRSVAVFIAGIADDDRRADAEQECAMLQRVSGDEPAMWGGRIVGFGERHVVYASSRELDRFDVGFSPRTQHTTLYLADELSAFEPELARLGEALRRSSGRSVRRRKVGPSRGAPDSPSALTVRARRCAEAAGR